MFIILVDRVFSRMKGINLDLINWLPIAAPQDFSRLSSCWVVQLNWMGKHRTACSNWMIRFTLIKSRTTWMITFYSLLEFSSSRLINLFYVTKPTIQWIWRTFCYFAACNKNSIQRVTDLTWSKKVEIASFFLVNLIKTENKLEDFVWTENSKELMRFSDFFLRFDRWFHQFVTPLAGCVKSNCWHANKFQIHFYGLLKFKVSLITQVGDDTSSEHNLTVFLLTFLFCVNV